MNKPPLIFSGNVRQCLDHYAQTLPTSKSQVSKARKPLADACNISLELAYRWLLKGKMPIGSNLIRLRYFFHNLGYNVSEMEGMLPEVFNFGQVICLGHISFEDACQELGYTSVDTLYAVIKGVERPSRRKLEKMTSISQTYIGKQAPDVLNRQSRQQSHQEHDMLLVVDSHQAIIDALRKQIEALLPLAQVVLSEDFSDDERRQLRRGIPDDGLYRTAQALHGLCSKKSRTLTLDKKRGEE
jgi:hypothetical protein